jgi:hypothetical protein
MIEDFNTEILGDCFVHLLQVDFIKKEIKMVLGGNPRYEIGEQHELIFSGVVWQEFNEFDNDNIFLGMEVSDSFEEFLHEQDGYMKRMKNYFPSGTLEAIEKDKSLKYFFITPTTGMGGFIICHQAVLTTKQVRHST